MAKTSEPTVRVLVTNGIQTSRGPGPGVVDLPKDEASDLVGRRYGRILAEDEDPADLGKTRRHAHGVTNLCPATRAATLPCRTLKSCSARTDLPAPPPSCRRS